MWNGGGAAAGGREGVGDHGVVRGKPTLKDGGVFGIWQGSAAGRGAVELQLEPGQGEVGMKVEEDSSMLGDDIFPPPLPSIVLGIPTVPRPKGVNYLEETLEALLPYVEGDVSLLFGSFIFPRLVLCRVPWRWSH